MIIVLCGKSNAGKGYVSNLFEKLDENTIHLDIDKIAHKINEEDIVKKDLVNTFGENILTNGKIDRKKL
ncbi:MAG: dephospho-CoA kinase [Bacilli bacterium]|nr:dephospho-CoA kinase [Bacilli bacterium]